MNFRELASSAGLKVIGEEDANDITPDIAEDLLALNTRNRPLDNKHVEFLTRAMIEGNWRYVARTLVFSEDGILRDGQHELTAISNSGITARCHIAVIPTESAESAQAVMDAGKKRSFADRLAMDEVKNYKLVAAVTRNIWNWETFGIPSAQNSLRAPTPDELWNTLQNHPKIKDTTSMGIRNAGLLTSSLITTLAYLFGRFSDDPEVVDSFFREIKEGQALREGMPTYTLRNALIADRAKPQQGVHTKTKYAWTIKAWNAYAENSSLHQVKWSPKREPFPNIRDFRTI